MTQPHHIFIAGAGGIGRALALILLDEACLPCRITLGDLSLEAADSAVAFARVAGDAISGMAMPAEGSPAELQVCLESADVIVDCLPGSQAPRIARLARKHGCHYLNLTEYVHETNEVQRIAEGASTAFALQCGLAPGTINVLGHRLHEVARAEWGIEVFDSLRLRVGALPLHVRAPHFYGWTWSPVGVATEYVKDAIAVRNFETVSIASLSERMSLVVDGLTLEEDLTSGGAADMPEALAGKVRDLDYKTLRHPGHYAWAEELLADIPAGAERPALLQEAMEEAIPRCEDDQVIITADLQGRDAQGLLLVKKAARSIKSINVAGRRLRAIQSTTAAGVAEVLRIILEDELKGPILQSQIPAERYLAGPFVQRAYGNFEIL
ncbi:MAG: saccharopine dehydrogenase-like NADP-dependent oxidoreductase [Planctomycetota bacterium]|jgi:saccharopine dehydrogenase-like NADP-dependent oxidoreductase